jgi:hypothetical protein
VSSSSLTETEIKKNNEIENKIIKDDKNENDNINQWNHIDINILVAIQQYLIYIM